MVAVGAFNPFVARLVEAAGFDAVYVSGAALANSLAKPDEGLISRRQVTELTRSIADVVGIPVIVDCDTGFGGPRAVARTVEVLASAGAAAVQIEDQDPNAKRCGHLPGKQLIPVARMAAKIGAAAEARGERGPLIVARTDARAVEGLDGAIERAGRYVEAGADIVFPEAPRSRDEFHAFRHALRAPLMANMTEFGQSPWLTDAEFAEMGYEIVLHPATSFRLAARAIEEALAEMKRAGNQRTLVEAERLMNRGEIDAHLVREAPTMPERFRETRS